MLQLVKLQLRVWYYRVTYFLNFSVPLAPKGLNYEPTDTSTVRLLWDTPTSSSKDSITNYEILFTLDKTKPLSQWDVQEVDGTSISDTVSFLLIFFFQV